MSKPGLCKSSYTKNVGYFYPIHRDKYRGNCTGIIYRSGLEKSFMSWCDRTPSIVQWSSEEVWVPYQYDGRNRKYYVDFVIKVRDKHDNLNEFLIEVKMSKELTFPKKPKKGATKSFRDKVYQYHMNKAKWESAKLFAKKKSMKFMIITEKTINKRG